MSIYDDTFLLVYIFFYFLYLGSFISEGKEGGFEICCVDFTM